MIITTIHTVPDFPIFFGTFKIKFYEYNVLLFPSLLVHFALTMASSKIFSCNFFPLLLNVKFSKFSKWLYLTTHYKLFRLKFFNVFTSIIPRMYRFSQGHYHIVHFQKYFPDHPPTNAGRLCRVWCIAKKETRFFSLQY